MTQEAKTACNVISPVLVDGTRHEPGDVVELGAADLDSFTALGVVEVAEADEPNKPKGRSK